MKIPGLLLLLSASLALAQTPAADQAARSYKAAHDKLSVKHEADMGKKTGDKEKMKKAYRKEVEKLDARYLPVVFDEIGLAQKEGDAAKEQELKQTLEKIFGTKVGTVLTGGKLVDVPSDAKVKIGSPPEGSKIRIQYVCGTWNVYPTSPMVSPDDTNTPQCNIKLFHSSISGEETVIAPNIKHTRDKPFEHVVALRGSYFLQISGTVGNAHSGNTVYRVAIDRD